MSEKKPATSAKAEAVPNNSVSPVESAPFVVGEGDTDQVFLSRIIYKNMYSRRSLSVLHLQRRLTELGYVEANADEQGYFGELTAAALGTYQADQDLEVNPQEVTMETLERLFDGDRNVTLAP